MMVETITVETATDTQENIKLVLNNFSFLTCYAVFLMVLSMCMCVSLTRNPRAHLDSMKYSY